MNSLITFAAVVAVAFAKPGFYAPQHVHADSHYHGPPAPLAHDGTVIDTPEVAHAKAAHFAAHAEAAAHASWSGPADDYHSYEEYSSGPSHGYVHPVGYSNEIAHIGHGYHGPAAPLGHDGRVVETPEVAHLKAAHLAAHAEAAAKSHYYAGSHLGDGHSYEGHSSSYSGGPKDFVYHGPAAPLAHDGTVIDTPEVAHAKAAHLSTHAHAQAQAIAHGSHGWEPTSYKW